MILLILYLKLNIHFFLSEAPTKGKRGRSKQELKEKTEAKKAKESVEETTCEASKEGVQEKTDEAPKKPKRKVDRFNGMTEAEVMTKTLPDILAYNLDFVIVSSWSMYLYTCFAWQKQIFRHIFD